MFVRTARRAGPLLAAVLVVAASAAPAHAYRVEGIPWPGRPARITYWDGTGYKVPVARAVAAWNGSGARVRFVPAAKRRAQLRIVYDERRGGGFSEGFAHGAASVGYQPRNRITLGRRAHGAGLVGLIAHELGHVLGLVHDDRRCAVMNSAAWSRCTAPPPCGILQRDDVRGAIARYGGRLRAPSPELCPPPPEALAVGRLPGTDLIDAAVTVPPGTDVVGVIERHAVGRCPGRPPGIFDGRQGQAGAVIRFDVTPRGTLVPLAGSVLCVRAWTFDATGRLSAEPLTQQIVLQPAAAP